MSLTFDEQIARIEADPLLTALSKICDLGTCGGRGGFQKALDIASAAVEAGLHAPDTSRETSAEVASIAWRLLNGPFVDEATCDRIIEALAAASSLDQARAMIKNELSVLGSEVHMLAASALGQRA